MMGRGIDVIVTPTLSSPSQRLSLRGRSPSGAEPEPEAVKGEGDIF